MYVQDGEYQDAVRFYTQAISLMPAEGQQLSLKIMLWTIYIVIIHALVLLLCYFSIDYRAFLPLFSILLSYPLSYPL